MSKCYLVTPSSE